MWIKLASSTMTSLRRDSDEIMCKNSLKYEAL